jgi:transposase
MAFNPADLPTDIDALHQIVLAQEAELAVARAGLIAKALEIEKYKLQIARLRRMQFGRSSEKIERTIEQLELKLEELEAETPAVSDDGPANDEQPAAVEQSFQAERKKSERRKLPAHLPARDVLHEPGCTCPACGGEMRKVRST